VNTDAHMVTRLKRSAHEQLGPEFKRSRNDESSTLSYTLEKMNLDVFDSIIRFLDIDHLMALSGASKNIKLLAGGACIWQSLCKQAKVLPIEESCYSAYRKAYCNKEPLALLTAVRFFMESKNHYTEKNINLGLSDLYAIRSHRDLKNIFDNNVLKAEILPEIAQRIGYFKALYEFFSYDGSEFAFQQAWDKLQPAAISKLSRTNLCFANYLMSVRDDVVDCKTFMQISNDVDTPLWICLEAEAKRAIMILLQDVYDDDDDFIAYEKIEEDELTIAGAVDVLLKIHTHQNASSYLRDYVGYNLGFARAVEAIDGISDNQAAELLHKASLSPHLNDMIKECARFNLAFMCVKKRTTIISDPLTIELLRCPLSSTNLNLSIIGLANLYLAEMRFELRTESITDDHAAMLFTAALEDMELDQIERTLAGCYLALMQFSNRISMIDDNRMSVLLINATLTLQNTLQTSAMLCLAQMRFNHRTSLIDDAAAARYFNKARLDTTLTPIDQATAGLHLSHMYFQGRSNIISYQEAVTLYDAASPYR